MTLLYKLDDRTHEADRDRPARTPGAGGRGGGRLEAGLARAAVAAHRSVSWWSRAGPPAGARRKCWCVRRVARLGSVRRPLHPWRRWAGARLRSGCRKVISLQPAGRLILPRHPNRSTAEWIGTREPCRYRWSRAGGQRLHSDAHQERGARLAKGGLGRAGSQRAGLGRVPPPAHVNRNRAPAPCAREWSDLRTERSAIRGRAQHFRMAPAGAEPHCQIARCDGRRSRPSQPSHPAV